MTSPTTNPATMTSPPPRGVGRVCELRALGTSRARRGAHARYSRPPANATARAATMPMSSFGFAGCWTLPVSTAVPSSVALPRSFSLAALSAAAARLAVWSSMKRISFLYGAQNASRTLIEQMRSFCAGLNCRHRKLSEYFGQTYDKAHCEACDVCLNEVEGLADATLTAQKILFCVSRTGERFGAEHIIDVLLGAKTERIRRWEHHQLSTYGLMKSTTRPALLNIIYQLIDDGLLERSTDERPVLRLNDGAHEVLQGRRVVRLLEPRTQVKKTRMDETSWASVDTGLFEILRQLRRHRAQQRLPLGESAICTAALVPAHTKLDHADSESER